MRDDRMWNNRITSNQLIQIGQADDDTCAKWWGILNGWEWPEELYPEEKPEKIWTGNSLRTHLIEIIDNKIGHKHVLWYSNVIRKKDMTNEEFEDFWAYTEETADEETIKRYLEAQKKRIEKYA